MDKERDKDPGIILSAIISRISDLVIQLVEDVGDGANAISEKGKQHHHSFRDAFKKRM